MAREKYNVQIREAKSLYNHNLTARERIMLKDLGDAIDIVSEIDKSENGYIVLQPVFYAVLDVHNEYTKETTSGDKNTDYTVFVILTADNNKYKTSSESFTETFKDIWEEIVPEVQETGEAFEIKCYGIPSKNYKGNNILSCSLI